MIITKTPFRISFLGGGTDFPAVSEKWGGLVVGTAINKYCYITCRYLPPFFDYKTRLSYSKIETVKDNHHIEHKAIKACLEYLNLMDAPIEISHTSDLPAYSGIGSSSSFVVGLLKALYELKSEPVGLDRLYYDAVNVEQDLLKENVGCQDQAWAVFGGIGEITFFGRTPGMRKLKISPIALAEFAQTLLMFYTKIPRVSSNIAGKCTDRDKNHHRLVSLAKQGIDIIERGYYLSLGPLMTDCWNIKKELHPEVTNPTIDEIFDIAIENGATGGKLMGAGGGGCLVFSAPKTRKIDIIKALSDKCVYIPFSFEDKGSHLCLMN